MVFKNFHVHTYGYNEEPFEPDSDDEPTPDPEPEPIEFHPFYVDTDQRGYGDMFEMYLKGLEDRDLTTDAYEMKMGPENQAWMFDYEMDSSYFWAYTHDYRASSISFDVDVSDMDCACGAGVFAVDLDNEECSWDSKNPDWTPSCSSVDLMVANTLGFNVATAPYDYRGNSQGTCDGNIDQDIYGPGTYYSDL